MLKWVFVAGLLGLFAATYLSVWLYSKIYYVATLILLTALTLGGFLWLQTDVHSEPEIKRLAQFLIIYLYGFFFYIYSHKYFLRHEFLKLIWPEEFHEYIKKKTNPSIFERAMVILPYALFVVLVAYALLYYFLL